MSGANSSNQPFYKTTELGGTSGTSGSTGLTAPTNGTSGGKTVPLYGAGSPATNSINLHTGLNTTSSSSTPPASSPAAPATSNGGFLDFIVAIVALVMMLNAHKFTKELLDHLFPGGGKGHGPGAM